MPRIDGAHFSPYKGAKPEQCCEGVWSKGRWPRQYQCSRKVTVTRAADDGVEYGFCGQHDPIAAREKRREREAKAAEKLAREKARRDARTVRDGLQLASEEQLLAEVRRRGWTVERDDEEGA